MKNIHIIPTEKPSRLIKDFNNKLLLTNGDTQSLRNGYKFQNIYITNDEKIKDGDWFYDLDTKYVKVKQSWEKSHLGFNGKKIILTTDPDLIADGVQSIPDDFLEWVVKNPSCEQIEIFYSKWYLDGKMKDYYKALIPKKEKCICENPTDNTCNYCNELERKQILLKAELNAKQETLEEAGLKHCDMLDKFPALVNPLFSFKEGAKWQQERSYSEAIDLFITEIKTEFKDDNWDYLEFIKERVVEQFKKK